MYNEHNYCTSKFSLDYRKMKKIRCPNCNKMLKKSTQKLKFKKEVIRY